MASVLHYVDAAAGGGGDGAAWGTAWTLAEAIVASNAGVVGDGDIVNLRGSFTIAAAMILTRASVDAKSYVKWRGCTAVADDGGFATITGVAMGNANMIQPAHYHRFENLIVDGSDNANNIFSFNYSDIAYNCEMIGGNGYAIANGLGQYCYGHDGSRAITNGEYANCLFNDFDTTWCVYGCVAVVNCIFRHCNPGYLNKLVYGCVFDQDSNGQQALYSYAYSHISNCTFMNCTNAGGALDVMSPVGIDVHCGIIDSVNFWNNNLNVAAGQEGKIGVYTEINPQFVDPANLDYRITNPALIGACRSKVGLITSAEDFSMTPAPDQVARTLPDDGLVISPTAFGLDADPDEGEYDAVVVGRVRKGVSFGDEGAETGTDGMPTAAQVLLGVGFGEDDTEYTGEVVIPSEDDVRLGVVYGPFTGNMVVPAETDVRDGVDYGTSGTEFEGNATFPATSDVRAGTKYGANGTQYTGTLIASSYEASLDLEIESDSILESNISVI